MSTTASFSRLLSQCLPLKTFPLQSFTQGHKATRCFSTIPLTTRNHSETNGRQRNIAFSSVIQKKYPSFSQSGFLYKFVQCAKQSTQESAILKHKSPLHVKRPMRKKIGKIPDDEKTIQINNVVAYAVAEEIDLQKLENHLMKQGLYHLSQLPSDVSNAIHVCGKYNVERKPKHIFVFEDGSVVFWSVTDIERGAFLKMLVKFSNAPYHMSLTLYEKEEIDFTFAKGKSRLLGDIIQLSEGSKNTPEHWLELYTFSNALSQSVKLSMWESGLNKYIDSIERVTEDLRHGRKISMSRRQVLRKTGELFSLRHLINLSSDLLDTPDFYWDRNALEAIYQSTIVYLNIARRTRVMNERLSHCCELTELLSSQLNDAHHTRLEVMIIVLILVEVVFEIVHYAERYIGKHEEEGTVSQDHG